MDEEKKQVDNKLQICKRILETGKCPGIKDKTCNFAHNATSLNLIPNSAKIKNLQTVIQT